MPDERMYPILPCPDLDEAIAFYEALGFTRTYRQIRPNPHAVVERDEIKIHLAGIDGFVPEDSYASVIIVVPDPDALHAAFVEGWRTAFGKVAVAGIPRMVRPRKRWGTVYGFSVVDVGGNWLRISGAGAKEPAAEDATPGLAGVTEVAARLADARGDDATALKTLEQGLARHLDAPAIERAHALLYRAELAVRVGDADRARTSLAEPGRLTWTRREGPRSPRTSCTWNRSSTRRLPFKSSLIGDPEETTWISIPFVSAPRRSVQRSMPATSRRRPHS